MSQIIHFDVWWMLGNVSVWNLVKKERVVADYWNCGFVKYRNRFSHKMSRFRPINRNKRHIPLLNLCAVLVSFAVCLQLVLAGIKGFLRQWSKVSCISLLSFSEGKVRQNSHLHFRFRYDLYSNMHIKILFKLGIFSIRTNLWSFVADPYHVWWRLFLTCKTPEFWNSVVLLHFEWAFSIW